MRIFSAGFQRRGRWNCLRRVCAKPEGRPTSASAVPHLSRFFLQKSGTAALEFYIKRERKQLRENTRKEWGKEVGLFLNSETSIIFMSNYFATANQTDSARLSSTRGWAGVNILPAYISSLISARINRRDIVFKNPWTMDKKSVSKVQDIPHSEADLSKDHWQPSPSPP